MKLVLPSRILGALFKGREGRRFSPIRDESGVAYVELAIVIFPFILCVIFVVFECARLIRFKHGVTFLARVSALEAFRECSPYQDTGSLNACCGFVRNRMETLGRATLGNFDMDIIISVYDYSATGVITTLCLNPDTRGGITTTHGFSSLLEPVMNVQADLVQVMNDQKRVAAAEINLVHNTLFPPSLTFFDFTRFNFYEVAIY